MKTMEDRLVWLVVTLAVGLEVVMAFAQVVSIFHPTSSAGFSI